MALSIVLDNEEEYESDRAWDQAQGQAFDAEQEAIDAILESTPTTIAGVVAVLEILGVNLYADEDDYTAAAANELMLRLAETLRSLLGEQLRAAALRTVAAAG
jgi:hypothetical protein